MSGDLKTGDRVRPSPAYPFRPRCVARGEGTVLRRKGSIVAVKWDGMKEIERLLDQFVERVVARGVEMRVRIHRPLWGGFPTHWVVGDPGGHWIQLFQDESRATSFSVATAELIARKLSQDYPGAVVQLIDARGSSELAFHRKARER